MTWLHPLKEKALRQTRYGSKGQTVYETIVEDPGVEDKRVLIVESEFASPLKVMRREGNTLSPTIRQAWDGVILRTLTKNSPAQATEGHVSILGHITSAELRFGGTESSNGFANRFLFACVRRANVLPEGGCLAVRGESPTAFERRCIPPDGVAFRSNTAGILPDRAVSARRIAVLGASGTFTTDC